MLEQVWSCGAALPNSLVNRLDTGDREEENEFDFDDFSESDGER